MSYILLFENKKKQKVFHNDTVFPASCESWSPDKTGRVVAQKPQYVITLQLIGFQGSRLQGAKQL